MAHLTRVLKSEWTKVTTVRSTLWTLVLAFFLTVSIGIAFSALLKNLSDEERGGPLDPTYVSFSGMSMGQLAMVAFGVLVVSGEYSTGMIRASLGAVPQRGVFMSAKLVACTALALVVGMVTSVVTFFGSQLVLGDEKASITDDGVLRAVVCGGLYMTLMALFSMGVTWMLRSPLLAFSILMPFFFIVSGILGVVEATRKIAQFLPDQAGMTMLAVNDLTDFDRAYGPGGALLIMLAWVAAALIGGYVMLKRRDA
ncbi:ABC transporter permease [Streptomyces sp. XM4193]|uniref:ABC transporter permease subunit n=1 Tax=Streptomyces sp. XM4193 TaxID=2929782 RepID=UPI001FF886DD|nr:ABC transporter permease subunit [Streptomyces sp. XM4193]MCK1797516.1 ABC transporter permease [Streptomyces sp. XM4193]